MNLLAVCVAFRNFRYRYLSLSSHKSHLITSSRVATTNCGNGSQLQLQSLQWIHVLKFHSWSYPVWRTYRDFWLCYGMQTRVITDFSSDCDSKFSVSSKVVSLASSSPNPVSNEKSDEDWGCLISEDPQKCHAEDHPKKIMESPHILQFWSNPNSKYNDDWAIPCRLEKGPSWAIHHPLAPLKHRHAVVLTARPSHTQKGTPNTTWSDLVGTPETWKLWRCPQKNN